MKKERFKFYGSESPKVNHFKSVLMWWWDKIKGA
jgi:hypothetical protein